MKRLMRINFIIYSLILCFLSVSCSKDHPEWENGQPGMEHVYYYCFEKWGSIPGGNDVTYNIEQGKTLAVPTQFYSNFTRSYSPEVFYYTTPMPGTGDELVCGQDYVVVDESGKTLSPDESGAYKMVWPNAKKGVQNIYIKALNGKIGSIRVYTFDPTKSMDVTDVTTTTIIKTDEYEVRAMSENYYVTVVID